ncbi:MAG: type II toxin-antitoxin system prevent-host-death family antitoxin, partial [Microlunatus sp.]|nr:type II toxin-antitoxin system prevent-host-death family antitoxin [Microlunatus sp.]
MTATQPVTTAGEAPVAKEPTDVTDDYTDAVRDTLTTVLPIALREVEADVASSVSDVVKVNGVEQARGELVSQITGLVVAGLGGAAAPVTAGLLTRRLADQGLAEPASWLREALKQSASSRLATLTDFSNNRNAYVKEVEDGNAVFLTRRGVVVAAVLPVAPGQYEQEVYAHAARRLLAERDARPRIRLTSEQVADIAQRGAVAAAEHGIDTSGWQQVGPD